MSAPGRKNRMKSRKKQRGFSLLELLVAVAILLIVSGTVLMGMMRVTWSQSTIMNRTQVHSSVRNATELMQQEIGQAGKLGSAPNLTITFAAPIVANGAGTSASPSISTTSGSMAATYGLYAGEQIVVDPNDATKEETVTITAVSANSITATFYNAHSSGTAIPALVMGGFASGIVPPATSNKLVFSGVGTASTTLTTDKTSDGFTLKLYGDLNGDGTMYYVAYKCSPNGAGTGTLFRYVSTDLTTPAASLGTGTLLLDNLATNPGNEPCFVYTFKDLAVTINGGQPIQTFVVNVAVKLTVQTQNKDAQTGRSDKETKALLNISPRNVFDAWELASSPSGYTRAQPMPANVLNSLLTATLQ